ncbi:DNA polymerase III subunit delta', partial [Patescibacteria group bacterium]|nr:DNA polymerase III subunit delta' [Patescibacteria group bacterium]
MNGHQKQWQFLKKSAELGRLPHALLFYGQEGLGKKALAIEFSKFLIKKTSPPDFILIEPQGKEIQIAQIRSLIQGLSFKPYLADFKIAVINKAHLMSQESQNCFLKFLEEPTDKTYLILITEYPAMLLPTILSRVQKLRFFPAKGFK